MTALLRAHFARAAALIALMTSACDDPMLVDDSTDDIAFRDGGGQSGPKINTNVILTSSVPQVDTLGYDIDGVRLTRVLVNVDGFKVPVAPSTLRVDHGRLVGTANGQPLVLTSFVGSEWTFRVDGGEVEATLTQVESAFEAGLSDPNDPNLILKVDPTRPVYTFTYESGVGRIATCEYDSVAGARMVLYGDIHVDHDTGEISDRTNTIYFGCFSGAIGKAALWGYAPDNPNAQSVELEAFETAARAVRADYCGDGTSYTQVGNMVTLLDEFGINDHTLANFSTEAVWEAGAGAQCVSRIRLTGQKPDEPIACADGHAIPSCPEKDSENEDAVLTGQASFWTKIP